VDGNPVAYSDSHPISLEEYFDGCLKLRGAGSGVLFILPDGKQLKYVLQVLWPVTNNEAEYEALLHGL